MKIEQKAIKDLDISILDGDRGKNYPHQDEIFKAGYCLFLSANNVTKKGFDFNETSYISKEKDETLRGGKIQRNDIIITTRGTVGNIAYYDDLIPYENIRINSGMLIVRCGDKLNSKYIYYALKNRWFQEQIKSIQTGSAQPQLPKSHFIQMKLPVPSLNIQNRVANILWLLDQKINTNIRINDNLYAQSKAIFDNYFINIDAIPAGWRKGNLLDIANYLNGLAMQKFRPQGHEIGLPVLKIKELRQGSCDDSSELCSLSIKPEYIIHNGDVIFSWSGSLLVDIWCGGTCGLNQHLFKVTSDVYDKWFYYLWTAHHLARFIAIAADKATTMGHIKREELAKAEVLIPCEEDYTSFNSIMQPIFELIISNRIESRKLAALRDELLPKLMTGEIDVSAVQL